jgi:hypothetical protein
MHSRTNIIRAIKWKTNDEGPSYAERKGVKHKQCMYSANAKWLYHVLRLRSRYKAKNKSKPMLQA